MLLMLPLTNQKVVNNSIPKVLIELILSYLIKYHLITTLGL